MDETIFKSAVAAISSGEYTGDDITVVKGHLNALNKKELSIKKQMEKSKNEFVKNKVKSTSELKVIRGEIKQLKEILKCV